MTLTTIARRLGHAHPPALLKMDIEAFEHAILQQWRPGDVLLPEQVNMEVHCTTEPISGLYRHRISGEQAMLLVHMYRLGYRLARLNFEGGGVDATFFVRVCCPIVPSP